MLLFLYNIQQFNKKAIKKAKRQKIFANNLVPIV